MPANLPFHSQLAARPNNRRHRQPTATHPQTTSTPNLSQTLVISRQTLTRAPLRQRRPSHPENSQKSRKSCFRQPLPTSGVLGTVDIWSRLFKMGHMQDVCGQQWPVSRLILVFYDHNLRWQRCSPCPSASSADKKVLRCSSQPFVDKKGLRCSPCPSAALRG